MSNKHEATYHPGEPLPQRDPFATLGSFDRTARPVRADSDEAYRSPGRPPWAEPDDLPLWPLYLVVMLAAAALTGLITALVMTI